MSADSIRKTFPQIMRRFMGTHKKEAQLQMVVQEYRSQQRLEMNEFTHLIVPQWSPDLQCCYSCGFQIRFGKKSSKM